MVFVKVCGLTNYDDARAAADAGADALGFVFWEGSPRFVRREAAAGWLTRLQGPMKVGVFVNASADAVERTVSSCGLEAVQLHGDESADDVALLRARVASKIIRVLRLSAERTPPRDIEPGVDFVLIDRHQMGAYGGTGRTVDWKAARELVSRLRVPVILSGGLSPENVREACRTVHPFGVDASSSLEKQKGIKDHARMREFIANAKNDP